MIFEGFIGLGLIHICVAVYAAVRTGVIGADVGAFGAAALFPCWFIAIKKIGWGEKLLYNLAVDTTGLFDSFVDQIIATAGEHPDSVMLCDGCQFVCQINFKIAVAIVNFQTVQFLKFGKIANDFAVVYNEAEITAFNVSFELAGKLLKCSDIEIAVANT